MRSDIALRKFLCISLSSGFIEDNWILFSAFLFNLLKYIVLIGVYEENSASYKYIAGKGHFILIISLNNGGYSPLVLHQNSQQLLSKVRFSVESEIMPVKFSYSYFKIYSTVNFEWICEYLLNFFCSNSMLCLSEDCQLSYTNLPKVDTFHYAIWKKSHFLISLLISSVKAFKHWVFGINKVHSGRYQFPKILSFLWKLKFFITGNSVDCYPWSEKFIYLGKISSKHSSQINDSLSVSHFSSTINFTQQFSQQILSLLNNSLKIMASSSHNINKHTGTFFLKTFIILWYGHQRAFCMISFYHTEW